MVTSPDWRILQASRERWFELRQQEHAAALRGGSEWQSFVRRCERELGLPWNRIREEFERIPMVRVHG